MLSACFPDTIRLARVRSWGTARCAHPIQPRSGGDVTSQAWLFSAFQVQTFQGVRFKRRVSSKLLMALALDENSAPADFTGQRDAPFSPFFKSLARELGGSPACKLVAAKNLL